jgi:hypothetical protein
MKYFAQQLFIIAILVLPLGLSAQKFKMPEDYAFNTKEDYKKYEKTIIACTSWLENNQETEFNKEKRAKAINFLAEYTSGAPNIKFEKNVRVNGLFAENPTLSVYFMAGWVRNTLTSDGKPDRISNCVAGLKSVLNVYSTFIGFKKSQQLDELVKIEQSGKLRNWVEDIYR